MSFKDIRKAAKPQTQDQPAPDPKTPVVAPAPLSEVETLRAALAKAEQALNVSDQNRTVDATVDTDAENVVITGADASAGSNFLSNLVGGAASVDALIATMDTDGGGGAAPFPVLTQANGVTGGAFQAVALKAHANADLPEGQKPFIAVFLGYRLAATAWPKPYDDTQKTPDKPVFSVAIPASDSVNASTLMMAGRQYQYSSKRDTWAVAAGGPGLISPAIELLLMDPENQELFVFRCCSNYNSAKDTRDQLLKQATKNNGKLALTPFVGRFSPLSEQAITSKGRKVVHHYPSIERIDVTDERGRQAWTAYAAMAKNAPQALQDAVHEWMAGLDAPLTPSVIAALSTGAAFV